MFSGVQFSAVLVDEASQCTEPSIFIPLTFNSNRIVLVCLIPLSSPQLLPHSFLKLNSFVCFSSMDVRALPPSSSETLCSWVPRSYTWTTPGRSTSSAAP